MKNNNLATGLLGEQIAASYLEERGYTILEKRYRFEGAEVDLVAFEPDGDNKKGEIVFVEVKTRRSRQYGHPEESVTLRKQQSITKAAAAYLYETKMERAACRFDVIAIEMQNDKPDIEHFRDAFTAGE